MENITWISFIASIIGVTLSAIALINQQKDKPNIMISEIRPGISGSKKVGSQQWDMKISCIEVLVENRGLRPAIDCEALITFMSFEALPLHMQTREHVVDIKRKIFDIQANSKIRLVGAWNYCQDGAIDGTAENMSLDSFLDKCTPATVTIKYGKNIIKKELSKEATKEMFREHSEKLYLRNI
jgi:hypothetical protein